jgi:acetolactate synthase-1/2/3 large subunit
LIQVGSRLENLGRNRVPELGVVGDAALVLGQLREAFRPARGWRERIEAWARVLAERQAAERARLAWAEASDDEPIHPLRVCVEVRDRLRPGDVAALDGGEFGQWARWAFGGSSQRVLLNGKFGMIGCGIPFALGAKVAAPAARVVAFVGDGAFGFHGFELDTAVRHGLPVVMIVGNDAGWSAERHRQRALYGPERVVAADLLPTRYDEVARGLGAEGVLVERAEALGPAIDRALARERPS